VQVAQTGLPNYLVAEVVALAEIVQQPLVLLVVLVVMVDYPLVAVVAVETLMLELAELAAMAVTVWFVFILGNQL
jgi:hypothetical protein